MPQQVSASLQTTRRLIALLLLATLGAFGVTVARGGATDSACGNTAAENPPPTAASAAEGPPARAEAPPP